MSRPSLLPRLGGRDREQIAEYLRRETVGGALLIIAATIAFVWANSPWRDAYTSLGAIEVGPEALHLHLSLSTWAADGLLALFFFVAGLELKRELVIGSLRRPATAVLPVGAALGGMVVPALLYVAITWGESPAADGWGIPMATDIAFALAVLAVVGRGLPAEVRAFLLTLAVADDLGAISVIAVFYTETIDVPWLLVSVALIIGYGVLQQRRVTSPWIYVPLAAAAWTTMHSSGVHATVAGVALGLLTRVKPDPGEDESPAERLEDRLQPWSAGVAVPVFAFFAAGVTVVGTSTDFASSPVLIGTAVGLVVGKFVGVFGTTVVLARFTRAQLSSSLRWSHIVGVALVSGVGFTVSLLIAGLAFSEEPSLLAEAKVGILVGSFIAAGLAALALRRTSRLDVDASR
jgi:NhaA family Na+:H+ antiporter